jgi:ABC-type Fe3+/spermidine/putrescine transport system ATPase subunit
MKAELQSLHRRVGVTVIYVTHDQSEALALSNRVVVMRDGEIEGVDSPHNLYNLPSSRYIASFIGDANLLSGRITHVSDGMVAVESAVGGWQIPRERVRIEGEIHCHQDIDVVIRPESILVTAERSDNPGITWLTCAVVQVLYSGSTTLYVLRSLERGVELIARNEGQTDDTMPSGRQVEIGILQDRTVVVASAPK